MKKALIITIAILATLAAEWFMLPRLNKHKEIITPPTVITKTVTKTVSVPADIPVYHVGDTQNGITLVGVYHSTYQNMRGGNGPTPPTIAVVAFAFEGVSEDDINQFSVIRTTKGFVAPTSVMQVPECGSNACVVFEDIPALEFYYKDMKWAL